MQVLVNEVPAAKYYVWDTDMSRKELVLWWSKTNFIGWGLDTVNALPEGDLEEVPDPKEVHLEGSRNMPILKLDDDDSSLTFS